MLMSDSVRHFVSRIHRGCILKTTLAFGILAIVLAGNSSAPAYYYFYVNDGGANHVALVAEQIVPAVGGGLDYQYNVLNVSPLAGGVHPDIDGFSIMIGPQGGVAQQVSFIPPALNPGFGSAVNPVPAGLGGGNVPFLTAEGNTYSPVPWQFVEKDDRAGANSAYDIRWSATGGQPLPYFHYTRFDLFSPNGPVPGTGAVDPFSGSAIIDIDLDNSTSLTAILGTTLPAGTDMSNPNNAPIDPMTDLNPYDNDPTINAGGIYNGVTALAPEPSSIVLGLMGASAVLLMIRKR
jgi:hypothetical protein